MLPSVRPLMQQWSCGPLWEFADRNQIINACSRHDEYIWFFRPRLADCCAMPLLRPTTLCEYPGPSSPRSPVCACSLVSSLLLVRATMSQDSSLTQLESFYPTSADGLQGVMVRFENARERRRSAAAVRRLALSVRDLVWTRAPWSSPEFVGS